VIRTLICLSKSISGYGLPMAITLIKPELDIWSAGEHNGTFRGHNLAFISATESLNYWKDDTLSEQVRNMEKEIRNFLADMVKKHPEIKGEVRGRGFMQGIACGVDGLAVKICSTAFTRGLIMETSGARDEVIKIMPPLTIYEAGLQEGLNILKNSIEDIKVQSFINSKGKNTSTQKRLRASG
jgi:diaminobutyrate-2-oxoglutarate transaminase